MKNKFCSVLMVLVLAGALAFVSCGNGANGYEDFKFTLTGPQLEAMMNSGNARSVVTLDDYDFSLTVTLFVNGEAAEERNATANIKDVRKPGFEGIKLSFHAVPVGAEVYVQVIMDYEGEQIQSESKKIIVKRGSNPLVVEIKGIKIIQRIESDIVVFGDREEMGTLYYQISNIEEGKTLTTEKNVLETQSNGDFAFDSEGKIVYAMDDESNSIKIISQDIKINGEPLSRLIEYMDRGVLQSFSINIDKADNSLYILSSRFINGTKYFLDCYPSILKDGSIDDVITYICNKDLISKCDNRFAVNNKIFYCASADNLYKIELKSPDYEISFPDSGNVSLKLNELLQVVNNKKVYCEGKYVTVSDPSIDINDVCYVNDEVYVLFEQSSLGGYVTATGEGQDAVYYYSKSGFSRGGLIKISLKDNKTEVLGLNTNSVDLSNQKFYAYETRLGGGQPDNDLTEKLTYKVTPDSEPTPFLISAGSQVFQSVFDYYGFNISIQDDLDKYFCVPKRIVAIKPKKLVVLDGGVFFYTDKDILSYGNNYRLVEIDLKSFAIGNKANLSEAVSQYSGIKYELTIDNIYKNDCGSLQKGPLIIPQNSLSYFDAETLDSISDITVLDPDGDLYGNSSLFNNYASFAIEKYIGE